MGRFIHLLILTAIAVLSAGVSAQPAAEPVTIHVVHTTDIHSHFTNRQSALHLGGLARLATMIRTFRQEDPNTLVLDSGDFTEGTVYFTDQDGATAVKLMAQLGYDALALGNHEWLMGPDRLSRELALAHVATPILAANLDMRALAPGHPLRNQILPYTIKTVHGLRVGIFGLTTYQVIYNSFFEPVKVMAPWTAAKTMVNYLRNIEHCDFILALTHLGEAEDDVLARLVDGVDLILGGHDHILFKTVKYVNHTPIIHSGKWGEYITRLTLNIWPRSQSKKSTIQDYTVFPVVPQVGEDPHIAQEISALRDRLSDQWGSLFVPISHSDVDLNIRNNMTENLASDLETDAMRAATGADIAIDAAQFSNNFLNRGDWMAADFFNLFPHVYDPMAKKTWTVKKFLISGLSLRILIDGFIRAGLPLKTSGLNIVWDPKSWFNQVVSLMTPKGSLADLRYYSVAGTEGILDGIRFLNKRLHLSLQSGLTDSGLEVWRLFQRHTLGQFSGSFWNVPWDGRMRPREANISLRNEDVLFQWKDPSRIQVIVRVRNTGMTPSHPTILRVEGRFAWPGPMKPDDFSDLARLNEALPIPALGAGQTSMVSWVWDVNGLKPGRYAVKLVALSIKGEANLNDHTVATWFEIPDSSSSH